MNEQKENAGVEKVQEASSPVSGGSGSMDIQGSPSSVGVGGARSGGEEGNDADGCLPTDKDVTLGPPEDNRSRYRYSHKTGYWRKMR